MKKIFLLIISAFLFSVIQGCDKSTTIVDPPANTDVIWPLAVNNEWVYSAKYFDTTGAISSQENGALSIVKDSVILAEKIYVSNGAAFLVNRIDGLWEANIYDGEYLLFKYPCKLNDTYISNRRTVTVASLNENVTVPAGTYSCIKYVFERYYPSTGTKDLSIYYCSPKIGMVLFEHYDYYDNGTKTRIGNKLELVRVSLK